MADPPTAAPRDAAAREAEALRASIAAALKPGSRQRIDFGQLLHLNRWSTLDDAADRPRREVADELLNGARVAFQRQGGPGSRLGLFSIGGVFMPGNASELRVGWLFRYIPFDSSEARRLIDRIDALSESAVEWWPDDEEDPPADAKEDPPADAKAEENPPADDHSSAQADTTPDAKPSGWLRLRRAWRRLTRGPRRSPGRDRLPHLKRAYELATSVLAAVMNETERHERADHPDPDTISEQYKRDLKQVEERIARAEAVLAAAGQRMAQSRYGRGMVWGTVLLAVATALGSVAFALTHTDAAFGVAVPAGGLGAVVSVLQRMTTRRFHLDLESSGNLGVFGAVRPFVGAIFGLLVVGLLESNLLSVHPTGGSKLALYAVLGFFAGFNERFAQDALTASVGPILPPAAGAAAP